MSQVQISGLITMASAALILGILGAAEARAQTQPPAAPRAASQPAAAARPAPARARPAPATIAAPLAVPVTNPNSPLALAMAQDCATGYPDNTELAVPGPKGEIKLDRCYRGRAQLSCELNVLKQEAKALLDKYQHIVESQYPEIQSISGMCGVRAETLGNDLQSAKEFLERFETFKAEYQAKSSCAARVEDSIKQMSLGDLAQSSVLLKSIVENMDAEMRDAAQLQTELSDFAESIASSERAMASLQKIHRAVCMSTPPKREATQ